MKSTVLITSFKRSHLLEWGLTSLSRQMLPNETEFVVLNDGVQDETESVCSKFKDKLNIRYIFTGSNKKDEWRIPGYAINYGVKKTDSDLLFISCAEMYHMDNTIFEMVGALTQNRKCLTIPHGKDDAKGLFLDKLPNVTNEDYASLYPLENVHLPFFMGMNRNDFENIGGYDEDFTGCGYDDNDIVERMKLVGNLHYVVSSRVVHLWHQRLDYLGVGVRDRLRHNQSLFLERRNIPKRNVDREWGKL